MPWFIREMEGYVVSVRDNRNKGGKLTFNVLLIGLGLTLPVSDPGINVDLGDSVVAKVMSFDTSRAYKLI